MTQTESIPAWAMEMAREIVIKIMGLDAHSHAHEIESIARNFLVAAEARGMERAAVIAEEWAKGLASGWNQLVASNGIADAIRTAKDQPNV